MRLFLSIYLLFALIVLTGITQETDTLETNNDILAAESDQPLVDDETDEVAIGNFWDLIGQAGPIRYPIFGIFIVGIFLILIKTFELFMDKRQAAPIETQSMENLSLSEVAALVSRQSENMLSNISSTLLNVFQTTKNAESLHEEVANYIRFQQDNFSTFRLRIDFLSDTAGALGLLGTVWGMFIVFSSGDLEREIILTGMGIALLTTLLGLVVSIALNFSSTLAHGYFMKRLDQVKAKAEEIRFRLLEIHENGHRTAVKPLASKHNHHHTLPGSEAKNHIHENGKAEKEKVPVVLEPANLILEYDKKETIAGCRLSNIKLVVTDKNNDPVPGAVIKARVSDGKIENSNLTSDHSGIVLITWLTGQQAGRQVLEANVDGLNSKGLMQKLTIDTLAGEPKELSFKSNHQSGVPNKKLKKPLIAEVKDEFGNPVEGCNVHLEITAGNGKLGYGKESVILTTNREGIISIPFTLGKDPGFNVVDVSIKKANIHKKFQAMGQEVLV